MTEGPEIRLRLSGPLRVVRTDGADLTPRSAKAQGLLALLGSAPGGRRSRTWLQDKLWSDRGPEQGAASLRQALVEIRRSLGENRDCLITDAGWVRLDPAQIEVLVDPEPVDLGLAGEVPEFAEGLDVRDPEFEDWIRDQRTACAERLARAPVARSNGIAALGARPPDAPCALPPPAAPDPPRALARWLHSRSPATSAGVLILLLSVFAATVWMPPGPRLPEAAAVADRTPAPGAMPSIAVLPLASLGGGTEQATLVDGISRDMVTDLAGFGNLFVIAADSSFRFDDLSLPTAPRGTRPARAVRYVLTGSVQRRGKEFRVNVQLMETEFGRHLWAERFDWPADDLLKLQNEVVRRVVDVVGPVSAAQGKLRAAELQRLARIPTENLQAYDHYLNGVVKFEEFTPEANLSARRSFTRAVELDPGYGKAYAMAAWTHLTEYWDGRAPAPKSTLAAAEALAERAVAADPGEAYVHWALASVHLFLRRHDLAIAAYRRAVEINPNGADLLVYLGWALAYAGEPDEGIGYMQQAIARNPYHPGWYLYDVAWGHFVARRYQTAIDVLAFRTPTTGTHELRALCYAMLGREAEARRAMALVLAAKPRLSVAQAAAIEPFAREEDRRHYLAAMRAAGVPEHAP